MRIRREGESRTVSGVLTEFEVQCLDQGGVELDDVVEVAEPSVLDGRVGRADELPHPIVAVVRDMQCRFRRRTTCRATRAST